MTMQISGMSALVPKLINAGINTKVAQSRFFKEIDQARQTSKINPGGLFQPYTIVENSNAFGVAEGGPILQGGQTEYTIGSANIRQHWAAINFTGALERIKNDYLTALRRDQKYEGAAVSKLEGLARNYYTMDQVKSCLKMYARRENYFALQGVDESTIGVVTAFDLVTGDVQFDPYATSQGNRIFEKNQQITFYHSGTQRIAGLATSKHWTVVSGNVDHLASSNPTGIVEFDPDLGGASANLLPTNLAIGDTAHFRNAYGLLPTGVMEYVDDSGDINGIARSVDPAQFSSVIKSLVGSPAIGPLYMRELIDEMQGRMGYGVDFSLSFWANKCQSFAWGNQVYGDKWTRWIDQNVNGGRVKDVDLAVGDMMWDGQKINIDVDVPPDAIFALGLKAWQKIEQTSLQAYEFDSGNYIINPIDSNGDRLDARYAAVFSEYNWVCWDSRNQGRIEGLAYDAKHI